MNVEREAGLVVARFDGDSTPGLPALPGVSAAALFRVLEGDTGPWLALFQTESVAAVESIRAAYGAGPVLEYSRHLFAAPDARPISDSARYVFVIRIDLDPRIDLVAFNAWYNETHVPEVAPAGLRRGHRYASDLPGWPYLAIYDMDARDTLQSEALGRVRGFAQFTPQVTRLERTVLERVDHPDAA